jgi:hypothetical protein
MSPRIGEVIPISAVDEEPREAIVVGHDTAGNPQIIPFEAAASKENLMRYVGPERAHQIWNLVRSGQELGV